MSHYQPEPTPLGIDPVLSEYLHRELMRLADTFQISEETIDTAGEDIAAIQSDITALQTDKVAKAGDTMTGALAVTHATLSPVISIEKITGTEGQLFYKHNSLLRWKVFASSASESGGNAGTNFGITRYTDAGAAVDNPFSIIRSSGIVSMPLGATTATPAAADDSTRVATTNFVRTTPPNFGLIPDAGTPVDADYLVGLNADGVPAYANGAYNFGTIKSEVRSYLLATANTFTLQQRVALASTRGVANASGSELLEVNNTSTGAAMMTFHRSGAYAANFGIDTDNQLSFGGWSAGAISHKIVHSGNYTSYGGAVLATPQATTSGTVKDFTGIPAGVKEIAINFNGVSGNGTALLMVQIGDSGGIEVTGYAGQSGQIYGGTPGINNHGASFQLGTNNAAGTFSGTVLLNLLDSTNNIWSMIGSVSFVSSSVMTIASGTKALSAVLDRVRISWSNGTDTFDAGSVNIQYRM